MIFFYFIQILIELFSKQIVESRRGLIWFCTVCRCPIKRTLGLNGLRMYLQAKKKTV